MDAALAKALFLQRETAETHERYEEELARFSAIRAGEPDGTQPILDTFRSNTHSHLSRNPLRNSRYLFVVNATMATRFAIEGGVPMETAYNISDLFIQRMDLCGTQEEIEELLDQMVRTFAAQVRSCRKKEAEKTLPPSVRYGMDYIQNHLHERLTLAGLCREIHLTPTYYCALFKRETGMSTAAYIRSQKLEAACSLLCHSDYSSQEIAAYLAFSSHSHFCSQFRASFGCTPTEYRKRHFRRKWTQPGHDPIPSGPGRPDTQPD